MSESGSKIIKNTFFLYFRMLLSMGVALFSVRVVLETLGAMDYGLYNVVAGVVTMFSFLSGTMASASQRFFAFELGKNDYGQLRKVFSTTMSIYILIGLVIFILAETVGLWFINNKLSIPLERREAANWVYQFSIFSFLMTMFTVPYNAAIIAHEKMKVYAYVSILEVVLKLLLIYLLVIFDFDKLKVYSVLMFSVTTLVTFVYRTYCVRSFAECKYFFYWNKELFIEIIGFSGWNIIGNLALVLKEQGINILLNIFFNPIVNASRAIAFQVTSAITAFVTNLQTAMNPHITKKYSQNEINDFLSVINQGAKFSFYLMFILSLPVLLETSYILKLWLGSIPDYTVSFVRLSILICLVDTLYRTIVIGILATGDIKKLQLIVGGLNMLILPISYVLFHFGFHPETTFYVSIIISILGVIPRMYLLKLKVPLFSLSKYVKEVLFKVLVVVITSTVLPLILFLSFKDVTFLNFIIVVFSSLVSAFFSIYLLGLSVDERAFVNKRIMKLVKSVN